MAKITVAKADRESKFRFHPFLGHKVKRVILFLFRSRRVVGPGSGSPRRIGMRQTKVSGYQSIRLIWCWDAYGDGRILQEGLGRVALVDDVDERLENGRDIIGHLAT